MVDGSAEALMTGNESPNPHLSRGSYLAVSADVSHVVLIVCGPPAASWDDPSPLATAYLQGITPRGEP